MVNNEITVNFCGYDCVIDVQRYAANKQRNKALILLEKGTNERVAVATLFVDGLQESEVAIKDYSENEGMLMVLYGAGVISAPYRMINGFPVCRLLIGE